MTRFLVIVLATGILALWSLPPALADLTTTGAGSSGGGSGPIGNDLLLSDGASFLLLSDGVSKLCLSSGC